MAAVGTERPQVPQSSDPRAARYLNSRWRYLAQLGLQEHMEALCQQLLSTPRIPRNPYPGFVQHLRQLAARTRLEDSASVQGIDRDIHLSTCSGVKWGIAGVEGSCPVWGLPSILRCVSPEFIGQYTWLIHDVTLPLSSFRNASPYTIQVLPALTGPCIFTGTFFPAPPSVDILQILVIIGPDVERAISLYSHCVLEDLTRLISQRRHLVFRICIPVDEGGRLEVFSQADAMTRAAELRSCVQRAVLCRKQVRVECLWRVNPSGSDFQRGSKAYDLSVIQTSHGLREERVIDFSGRPLEHLFSCVFLQRSQAEAYFGLFLPLEECANPDLIVLEASQTVLNNPRAKDRRIPPVSELRDPESSGVLWSSRALRQVQEGLLRCIASVAPLPEGVLERAHLAILLLLSDQGQELSQPQARGDRELPKGLSGIGHFLCRPATELWAVDTLMKTLEVTATSTGEQAVKCEALSVLLGKATRWTEEELTMDEMSCDFPTLRKRLRDCLVAAVEKLSRGLDSGALEDLQRAHGTGQVLLAQLLEDSLPWIPALLEVERRSSDMKTVQPRVAIDSAKEEQLSPSGGTHLTHGEDLKLLYSTESSVEVQPSSSAGSLEEARCQYLVGCRLDQHWHRALEEILTQPQLLTNPYPSLVSAFRKASLRMDLWDRSDDDLLKLMFETPPEALEGEMHIFGLRGAVGFGLHSAVCAPNAKLLPTALPICTLLRNTSWEPRLGAFKVTVCSALQRPGLLDPFLNSVEITEFCSMQGPPGCQLEALQTYAKLVLAHLSDLQQRPRVRTPRVQIGVSDTWSIRRIQGYPRAFMETFREALQGGSPVCLKAWQTPEGTGWRFLPLVKYFVLHYSEGGGGRWSCYPENDPLTLYWAIFPSREEAVLHYQRAAPSRDFFGSAALQRPLSKLSSHILQDCLARDLLNMCRLVASRALLTGERDTLPACWRVLHSAAAQLEYLNTINTTVQALLEMEDVERREPAATPGELNGESAASPELRRMISGLALSLKWTLTHSSTLAPCSLWEMVEQKMQMVFRGQTAQESVTALGAVQVMCQAVMEALTQDLLSLCPEIQLVLRELQTQTPEPPRGKLLIQTPLPDRSSGQLLIQTHPPANTQFGRQGRGCKAPPTVYRALEGW